MRKGVPRIIQCGRGLPGVIVRVFYPLRVYHYAGGYASDARAGQKECSTRLVLSRYWYVLGRTELCPPGERVRFQASPSYRVKSARFHPLEYVGFRCRRDVPIASRAVWGDVWADVAVTAAARAVPGRTYGALTDEIRSILCTSQYGAARVRRRTHTLIFHTCLPYQMVYGIHWGVRERDVMLTERVQLPD